MIKLLASVAVAALLSVAACSPKAPPSTADTTTTTTTSTDTASTGSMAPLPAAVSPAQEFANAVAYGDILEIETSKVAQAKSANTDVKSYATMLIRDHTATSAKLKVMASNANMTVPAALDSAHQLLLDNITNADAKGFDDKYLDAVIDAHEAAIGKFEAYAKDGADPALKQFATDTLPTLRAHFNRGKTIRDAVNRS